MHMVPNQCNFARLEALTLLLVMLASPVSSSRAAGLETAPIDSATPEIVSNTGRTNSDFDYTARVWQTDEGLPHNMVRAIAQTTDGYLWVGTRVGLARFDGLQFTVFNPKNTPAMKSPSIGALCLDRDGALWIG